MRASFDLQFGALWEVWRHTSVAESLVVLYRVGTHQIWRGQRAARSSTNQGSTEPLCARIKARICRFLKEKLMSDVFFLPTWVTRSSERARFMRLFQGCTELRTAGCWLARRGQQLKPSATKGLGISIFLVFVRCVALRDLELLVKTDWSVTCPLCCCKRCS